MAKTIGSDFLISNGEYRGVLYQTRMRNGSIYYTSCGLTFEDFSDFRDSVRGALDEYCDDFDDEEEAEQISPLMYDEEDRHTPEGLNASDFTEWLFNRRTGDALKLWAAYSEGRDHVDTERV